MSVYYHPFYNAFLAPKASIGYDFLFKHRTFFVAQSEVGIINALIWRFLRFEALYKVRRGCFPFALFILFS